MGLVLSHQSAIDIYRSPLLITACPYFNLERPGPSTTPRHPVSLDRCSAPKKSDLALLGNAFPNLSPRPIHATVTQQNKRRTYDGLICHVNSSKGTALPLDVAALLQPDKRNKILNAVSGVEAQSNSLPRHSLYVVTPELAFIQAAEFFDLIDLILFGYELCGTYSTSIAPPRTSRTLGKDLRDSSTSDSDALGSNPLDSIAFDSGTIDSRILDSSPFGSDSFGSDTFVHRPFTNTAKISRFIEAVSQGHRRRSAHMQKAEKALGSVLDSSASPRESILALMLTAERSKGGYALPMPILNQKIPINRSARHLFSHSYYRCDLFWPDANLAVEYDSDKFHSGVEKISQDSSRRGALNLLGIDVITVTNRQISHVSEMDRVARSIAKKLNCRIRAERRYDYPNRKLTLQNRLLDYGSTRA